MRRIPFIFLLCCLFILSGCRKETVKSIPMMLGINVRQRLNEYDSPYTLCEKNSDGTYSFFIFSAPIQYKTDGEYQLIDNSIVSTQNKKYRYENKSNKIKTYFSENINQGIRLETESFYFDISSVEPSWGNEKGVLKNIDNFYEGHVQAIVYKSDNGFIYIYPSSSGIHIEMMILSPIKSLQFNIKSSENLFVDNDKPYLVFHTIGGKKKSIIQAPMAKGKSKKIYIDNSLNAKYEDEEYRIELGIDTDLLNDEAEYPIRIDIPLDANAEL